MNIPILTLCDEYQISFPLGFSQKIYLSHDASSVVYIIFQHMITHQLWYDWFFFIFRQQTKDKDSPAMIWTVILSLIPSVGPQVYLQNICHEHILLNLYKSITPPPKNITKNQPYLPPCSIRARSTNKLDSSTWNKTLSLGQLDAFNWFKIVYKLRR